MTEPTLDALADPLRSLQDRYADLIQTERGALWRYCRHLTRSAWDAEDLFQDTLARGFAHLARLYQAQHPRAYLFRIATNLWIDQGRRLRPETVDPADAELETAVAPRTDGPATAEAMALLVAHLTPRQRVVYLLTEAFDFTGPEVAAMIGSTEGAVKVALHRARHAVRRAANAPPAADPHAADEPVVARYLAAFNARDPEGIAALLHESCVAEIVGVAEEWGRQAIAEGSLAEWAAHDPQTSALAATWLDEPVVLKCRIVGGVPHLTWLTRLTIEEGQVTRLRHYYFTPEVLAEAGRIFGLPVLDHGTRYVAPDQH